MTAVKNVVPITHEEIRNLKNTVVIQYEWWGGQAQDRKWWCAWLNGEVFDYGKKNALKRLAEAQGLPWIVVRYHKGPLRGSDPSVAERSSK